jgi:hypothetical protein
VANIRMLRNSVTVVGDEDDSPRLDRAGAPAGSGAPTSRELVEVWMETVRANPGLIPDPVRELDDDQFCAWFLSSLDTFALGFSVVGREPAEVPLSMEPCLSEVAC